MWKSKTRLRHELDFVSEVLKKTQDNLLAAHDRMSGIKNERDEWRNRYELLLHTPEYKADTEAAFARGEKHATDKFRAWFLTTAYSLDKIVQEPNEE
jgi:hypothetical protein